MIKINRNVVAASAVCLCLGFLSCSILVNFYKDMSMKYTNSINELTALLESVQNENKRLNSELNEKNSRITEYENAVSKDSAAIKLISDELDSSRIIAGLTDVSGSGIEVTLNDSDSEATGVDSAALVIHDEDLLNFVNELNSAGAEAVSQKIPRNRFREKLEAGKKVVAVEVDPPVNDDGAFFLEAAARLKALGADAVTIADCPVARVRADSSILAAKLRRELDMDAIPHMTCRDRNLNAAKALLLGLSMEGVHNVLVVTGDPVPSASRDEVKAVFSFNSAMLAGYIRALGEETLRGPFLIAGALNVNAPNFDAELRKALRKKENGVELLMTQPVFTDEAVRNLRRAKEETGLRILGGLMPPVSYRNASYMHNEISGIRLSEEILERYRDTDRETAGKLGVSLCLETAEKIAPWVDGYYLMTPFQRIDLIEEIMRGLGR